MFCCRCTDENCLAADVQKRIVLLQMGQAEEQTQQGAGQQVPRRDRGQGHLPLSQSSGLLLRPEEAVLVNSQSGHGRR